jgi:hypothetical protein
MGRNPMTNCDYRFDILAHGLRKNNRNLYAFSTSASLLLEDNDSTSTMYSPDMWEEFWQELVMEYLREENQ